MRHLGLFPGTRIGPHPVAALSGDDVDECRRRLRALAASFVVTETSRDVFLMHDLVRLHALELAEAEMSEVDRAAAARRLLRYYLVGARDRARTCCGPGRQAVLATDPGGPADDDGRGRRRLDRPGVGEPARGGRVGGGRQTRRSSQLARLAAEFSEGTRALGPAALSRLVRLVV